jgi:hypothetical protein
MNINYHEELKQIKKDVKGKEINTPQNNYVKNNVGKRPKSEDMIVRDKKINNNQKELYNI